MDGYMTLAGEGAVELVIKKSRFLGLAAPLACPEAVEARLTAVRAVHPQASHHVFAYQLAEREGREGWTLSRMSDDGEPSGTAGRPVMGVVERSGLADVLVVVTRYFGGTLLGAGGLVRAYSQAASAALGQAPRSLRVRCYRYRWQVPYGWYGKAMNLLSDWKDLRIESSEFAAAVTITFTAPAGLDEPLGRCLGEFTQGQLAWEREAELYRDQLLLKGGRA